MLKSFAIGLLIFIVFLMAKFIGFFDLITQQFVFFTALGIVLIMLVVAFFVLRLLPDEDKADDDNKK